MSGATNDLKFIFEILCITKIKIKHRLSLSKPEWHLF